MVNIVIADIRKALEGQELCLFYFRILSTSNSAWYIIHTQTFIEFQVYLICDILIIY